MVAGEDLKNEEEHQTIMNELTKHTKDHNKIVKTYLSVLNQIEENEVAKSGFGSAKLARTIVNADCLAQLKKAS